MRNEMPETKPAIRIMVIDERELFRAGVQSLIVQHPGFRIVGVAAAGAQVIPLVRREQPDVILLGIDSFDREILDLVPGLREAADKARILVLTGSEDPKLNREAICLGAIGVLSKDKPAQILIKAIERIHAGEAWLDRSMTAAILGELSPGNASKNQDPEQAKIALLTSREREVIKLVGEGLKNRNIAKRLFISEITVHHHMTSIYSKLDVSDRLELLIYAYRNGLAELPR